MFHLFNRIYLEHEKWYSSKYEYLFLFQSGGKHPLSRTVDFPFEEIPTFQHYLDDHCSGSEETFWQELINKPRKKKFVLYVDSELYFQFQLQYWKSIFENLSVKDAYELHKFYYLDRHLKKYLFHDRGDVTHSDFEENSFLNFSEFADRFDKVPVIEALALMHKGNVSFEYLLGDYYFDKKSKYAAAFQTKLKNLCWKIWFDDIEILRSEIINAFYDIKKVIPTAQFSLDDVISVDQFIRSEPCLSWILDKNFNEDNIDYIKDTYSQDVFIEFPKKFRQAWDLRISSTDPKILEKITIQDYHLPTEQLFEGKYIEILEDNIQKNFGCRFVDETLRNKANQLLPCFVYDKVRSGKTEELKFLKLRGSSH